MWMGVNGHLSLMDMAYIIPSIVFPGFSLRSLALHPENNALKKTLSLNYVAGVGEEATATTLDGGRHGAGRKWWGCPLIASPSLM